jgi:hypothetical protein
MVTPPILGISAAHSPTRASCSSRYATNSDGCANKKSGSLTLPDFEISRPFSTATAFQKTRALADHSTAHPEHRLLAHLPLLLWHLAQGKYAFFFTSVSGSFSIAQVIAPSAFFPAFCASQNNACPRIGSGFRYPLLGIELRNRSDVCAGKHRLQPVRPWIRQWKRWIEIATGTDGRFLLL